jgi:type II secretory pathway pseudopilin PulG
MIVIAIIGILAAIAIPNFIAYRNKSFCTRTEADANGVTAAIADYFSIPDWVDTPTDPAQLNNGRGYTFTGTNTGDIEGTDPTLNITIIVTDGSGRCPDEYMAAQAVDSTAPGIEDGWDSANNVYYKYITP